MKWEIPTPTVSRASTCRTSNFPAPARTKHQPAFPLLHNCSGSTWIQKRYVSRESISTGIVFIADMEDFRCIHGDGIEMVSLSGEVGQLIQGEPSPKMQVERHQCPICHQVFGRSEHLVRHSRSHSSERSLKCAYCDKGFYRV